MFNPRAHEIRIDQTTQRPVVEEPHNYLMVSNNRQSFFVQHGQVYQGENSSPIPAHELPQWFHDAMARQTPEARQAVGYLLPDDVARQAKQTVSTLASQFASLPPDIQEQLRAIVGVQAPRIDEKAPKISGETSDTSLPFDGLKNDPEAPRLQTWTCEECGEETKLTHKGVHIARHRRQAKRGSK